MPCTGPSVGPEDGGGPGQLELLRLQCLVGSGRGGLDRGFQANMAQTAFKEMPGVTGPSEPTQPGQTCWGRCSCPGTGHSHHCVTRESKRTHVPDARAGLLLLCVRCSRGGLCWLAWVPRPARYPWAAPAVQAWPWRVRQGVALEGAALEGAVRKLGGLPFDATGTVPHGELSPVLPFTVPKFTSSALTTVAIVHLSASIPPQATQPVSTRTHIRQAVSRRAPGNSPNRGNWDRGLVGSPEHVDPRSPHCVLAMCAPFINSFDNIPQKEELGFESGPLAPGPTHLPLHP